MPFNEKQYHKNADGRYNQGEQRKAIPLKPIFFALLIIVLGVAVFKYHKPVLNSIEQWLESLEPNDDPDNTGEQVNNGADTMEVLPVDEEELDEYYSQQAEDDTDDENVTIEEVATPIPSTPKPDVKPVVTDNSKPKEKPTEVKPAEPKPENVAKYQIERFVDQQTGKYGLKDTKTNKILVEAIYDDIKKLKYNQKYTTYALAIKDKMWGIVSTTGAVLVPFEYDYIYDWCDKYPNYYELYKRDYSDAATKRGTNHLYGLVRMPDGKITVPVEYSSLEYAERYSVTVPGIIIAQRPSYPSNNRICGIINMNNEIKVPFEYYDIKGTAGKNHFKLVKRSGDNKFTYGIVRLTDCKIIIPVDYEELEIIGPASFIRAKKDGLYGCINDRNEVIVPFKKIVSTGSTQGMSDDSNNRVNFTYPDGSSATYNAKGERVPSD